jgi:hypothetical protein
LKLASLGASDKSRVHGFGTAMIVFTVAFGDTHIDRFFERCLPSLMTPGNLPSIRDEKLGLLIATQKQDIAQVRRRVDEYAALAKIFEKIEVITADINTGIADKLEVSRPTTRAAGYHLFMRSVTACFNDRQPFIFAAPDLLYSDGTVRSSWTLHKATGRTVAVLKIPIHQDKHDNAHYRALLDAPGGLKTELVKNMSIARFQSREDFDENETNSPTTDEIRGFVSGNHLMMFSPSSSPLLGRFNSADLLYFSDHDKIRMWDGHWPRFLGETDRLLVQTNTDVAVAMKPRSETPDQSSTTGESSKEKRERLFGDLIGTEEFAEASRRLRFHEKHEHYCFSMSLPDQTLPS